MATTPIDGDVSLKVVYPDHERFLVLFEVVGARLPCTLPFGSLE